MVERLVGMQALVPENPYEGARLLAFVAPDVGERRVRFEPPP
jgi:hypothetical protein